MIRAPVSSWALGWVVVVATPVVGFEVFSFPLHLVLAAKIAASRISWNISSPLQVCADCIAWLCDPCGVAAVYKHLEYYDNNVIVGLINLGFGHVSWFRLLVAVHADVSPEYVPAICNTKQQGSYTHCTCAITLDLAGYAYCTAQVLGTTTRSVFAPSVD